MHKEANYIKIAGVIGDPINHTRSPLIHNYWIKKNNINAIYDKKKIKEEDLKDIITDIKNEKIAGVNVTVPFKKSVVSFVNELSFEANKSKSVNTIYLKNKMTNTLFFRIYS